MKKSFSCPNLRNLTLFDEVFHTTFFKREDSKQVDSKSQGI